MKLYSIFITIKTLYKTAKIMLFSNYTVNLIQEIQNVNGIVMKWGDKENRIAIIALHKFGNDNSIIKILQPLGIS